MVALTLWLISSWVISLSFATVRLTGYNPIHSPHPSANRLGRIFTLWYYNLSKTFSPLCAPFTGRLAISSSSWMDLWQWLWPLPFGCNRTLLTPPLFTPRLTPPHDFLFRLGVGDAWSMPFVSSLFTCECFLCRKQFRAWVPHPRSQLLWSHFLFFASFPSAPLPCHRVRSYFRHCPTSSSSPFSALTLSGVYLSASAHVQYFHITLRELFLPNQA